MPPAVTTTTAIKKIPFIVLPHGGPYARTSRRFDYFAQYFATRGFGVLQMNFRGSSGFGATFEDTGRENWVVMQEDVTDGARWLIENGVADPERLCIAGWSFGGYAALMGAIKHPDIYSCAVSMAGVTDLLDLVNDLKKYRFGRLSANNSVLQGFDGRRDLKENSPVRRAEELLVPLFMAHGTRDEAVHFDQFKRMKSALRKSPAEVTFVEFEDEDHYLSMQKNRQEFFVKLDEFLETTIGTSEFEQ
jgi:dipeptidyl aminopeptidase/acylaminoacyl peptidase